MLVKVLDVTFQTITNINLISYEYVSKRIVDKYHRLWIYHWLVDVMRESHSGI